MADAQSFEQDLNEYLAKEDNLRREEKIRYLMAIFNKHQAMDALEHIISPRDLQEIISVASGYASTAPSTIIISGQVMSGHKPIHVQMIETVIRYMNKHSLLKRKVGFEYNR